MDNKFIITIREYKQTGGYLKVAIDRETETVIIGEKSLGISEQVNLSFGELKRIATIIGESYAS